MTTDVKPATWDTERKSTAARLRLEVTLAESRLAQVTQRRDNLVREALAGGAAVAELAEAFGVSRSRIYQIRDGRR